MGCITDTEINMGWSLSPRGSVLIGAILLKGYPSEYSTLYILWKERRRSLERTTQEPTPSSWRGSWMTEVAWITWIGSGGEAGSPVQRAAASTAGICPTDTVPALAALGDVP